MVGDIIGQPGMRALLSVLPGIRKKFGADFTVINAENAADGFGLSPSLAKQVYALGADVITTGNHIWHDHDIFPVLNTDDTLLRPANYPAGAAGKGITVVEVHGVKIAVLNLQGRIRMWPIDCPFKKAKELVRKAHSETKVVLVDFHADSPSEKEALAWHLDGEVSALVGTHTHVQSADERILPKGTAFMTDLGACAPHSSIIGFDYEIGMDRNISMVPLKNEVGRNPAWLRGVCLKIDTATGKALSIERFAELSRA